jgi:hypothetical protein
MITNTLAMMLIGRIKSCQRDSDEAFRPIAGAPAAIHNSEKWYVGPIDRRKAKLNSNGRTEA